MTRDVNDVLQQEGPEGVQRLLEQTEERPPEPPPDGAEPLHCPPSEASVVATALTGSEAADALLGIVSPGDFYHATLRAAWKAIDRLRSEGRPVDPVAVQGALSDEGTDPGPLDGLRPSRLEAAQEHARRVRNLALKRRTRDAARKVAEGPQPGESAEEYAQRSAEAAGSILANQAAPACTGADELIERVFDSFRSDSPPGYRTSLGTIHEIIPYFRPGELNVIAGRPSHGKSTLMRRIAADLARQGLVLFFSLEESAEEVMTAILAQESGVSQKRLQAANLSQEEWAELEDARPRVSGLQLRIDESARVTPKTIAARARSNAQKGELVGVFIDYLQLLSTGSRESRHLEIGNMTRSFKCLARELQTPVFVGSQLSRAGQRRGGGKRPKLHHLRDSGSIEADADNVVGVYRMALDEPGADWAKGIGEACVLKQRKGGGIGIALLGHDGSGFFDLRAAGQDWKIDRYRQGGRG